MPFLEVAYFAALVLSIAAAASGWMRLKRLTPWLGLAALTSIFLTLVLLYAKTKRPPVAGAIEPMMFMAFILGLLGMLRSGGALKTVRLDRLVWTAVSLLLSLLLFADRTPYPAWFMYDYTWARCFFLLRRASVAVILFSGLTAGGSLLPAVDEAAARCARKRAVNHLVAGTGLFLAGEFCGFTWALNWLGDYWRWGRNFLEATTVFLGITVVLHLPVRWSSNPRARAWAIAIAGCFPAILYAAHLLENL